MPSQISRQQLPGRQHLACIGLRIRAMLLSVAGDMDIHCIEIFIYALKIPRYSDSF